MIPELPKSVGITEKLEFYSQIISNLEDQSTVHVNWHTHRQNPSVCWICDMPIVAQKVVNICDELLSKSTLDMETELSSEIDSDLEIENENSEEEFEDGEPDSKFNEPEYDIVEDES